MVREGNTHAFTMFPEHSDFSDALCPIHRRSSASREDITLNFENLVFTNPIMTEICAACLFHKCVKKIKDIIVKEIRILLCYHMENQLNKHFVCGRVLRFIHEDMFMMRF